MRRSFWFVFLVILVSAIIGSVFSHILAKIFPQGPAYNLFCNVFSVGIPQFVVNLGFLSFSFGLTLSISGLVVLFIILALIILLKF